MITAEQKILRQKYLGASEVPAIMGCDQYQSAADVWLMKTGQADSFEGNEATRRGNLLEPAILRFAEEEIGKGFAESRMMIHPNGLMAANFDGLAWDNDFVVEGKSSRVAGEYGEPGTDEVPDKVVLQTHAQMLIAGPQCRVAYVPIITIGLEFRMYVVPRNDALCGGVLAMGTEFMEKYVRPVIRPSDFCPSLEVLKRVRREPKTIVDVQSALIDSWIVAKAAKKQAKDDYDAEYARMLTAMGGAEALMDENGRVVTYFEQSRKGYTVDPTTFRSLRIRKNAKQLSSTGGTQ